MRNQQHSFSRKQLPHVCGCMVAIVLSCGASRPQHISCKLCQLLNMTECATVPRAHEWLCLPKDVAATASVLGAASGPTGCFPLKASLLLILLGSQGASDTACLLALRSFLLRATSSWAQGMMPMA